MAERTARAPRTTRVFEIVCLAGAAALAGACGSRSALDASLGAGGSSAGGGGTSTTSSSTSTSTSSSGGTGGATGGAGGTGGSTGGVGGSPLSCPAMVLVGEPATLEMQSGMSDRLPRWTLSSEDGQRVTLVSSRQASEGPGGDAPTAIRHMTFEPWGVFPSGQTLGGAVAAVDDGGETVAAGRSPGGRFALLFDGALVPSGGLLFSDDFTPFQGGTPMLKLVDQFGEEAQIVAQGKTGHLLGIHSSPTGNDPHYRFKLAFHGADGALTAPVAFGCADSPMFGDAVFVGGRFMAAFSTSATLGGTECPAGGFASPDDVFLTITDGLDYKFAGTLGAPGWATDVKMAARTDGAWVVLGTPPGQVVNGMFMGARIDLEGEVVGTFPVGGGLSDVEIPLNGTLAATGVGDWLVTAWVDFAGDKGPFLNLKAFEPGAGALFASLQIFPEGSVLGSPVILGSPVSNSFLVAWAEWTPGGGDTRIRAVRVDCVQGL